MGPPVEMKIAWSEFLKEAQAEGFELAEEVTFLKYQYFLVLKPSHGGGEVPERPSPPGRSDVVRILRLS